MENAILNIAFTMFIDNIAIGNKVCNKSGHYFCSYQINTISKNWAKKNGIPYIEFTNNVTFFTIYYHDYSDMYFGCPSRTRLTWAAYCHYFLSLCNSFWIMQFNQVHKNSCYFRACQCYFTIGGRWFPKFVQKNSLLPKYLIHSWYLEEWPKVKHWYDFLWQRKSTHIFFP